MAATPQKFIQDIFSQEAILIVVLFVALSSPEAYRMTEGVLGRHGMVNVAVHGLVLVILLNYLAPMLKAGGTGIGPTGARLQVSDSRI
jgi:hypothetical protein